MLQRIRSFFAPLARDQRGLTTVEYAIVLCVIVAVSVVLWDDFGEAIRERLATDTSTIKGALVPNAGK